MNKKILLVGGEGYIGNVCAIELLKKNYKITSFDYLVYENSKNILIKETFENFNFVFGDINDEKKIQDLIKKNDDIVILAGLVGDPITKKYPKESNLINDIGIKKIIDICATEKDKKLIFVSTCSNYGLIKGDYLADEKHELSPLSLYAKSKVSIEKYILSLKNKSSMRPTILRFATAFGLSPRMRFDLTVNQFTKELKLKNKLEVFDENTWRPYCHVKDFAEIIHLVLSASDDKVSWQVFNSGGDSNNATKQMIVDKVLNYLGEGNVEYLKNDMDPRNYRVNFEKIRSVLKFEPKYTIDDGIKEIANSIENKIFNFNDNHNETQYGNYHISLNNYLNK